LPLRLPGGDAKISEGTQRICREPDSEASWDTFVAVLVPGVTFDLRTRRWCSQTCIFDLHNSLPWAETKLRWVKTLESIDSSACMGRGTGELRASTAVCSNGNLRWLSLNTCPTRCQMKCSDDWPKVKRGARYLVLAPRYLLLPAASRCRAWTWLNVISCCQLRWACHMR
jgi:hypothetical protein